MKRFSVLITSALVSATLAMTFVATSNVATASKDAKLPKNYNSTFTLKHGSIAASDATVTYTDLGEPGASVADLRTFYIPLTSVGRFGSSGYLSATLETVAVNKPTAGIELRQGNLTFVVNSLKNQIVVGGLAEYNTTNAVLDIGVPVRRPVLGGTGLFTGATGWCVSIHKANDTWEHRFYLRVDRG